MTQVDSNNAVKIKLYFILKKVSNVLLFLFGTLILIGIYMFFYLKTNPLIIGRDCIPSMYDKCLKELQFIYNFMTQLFGSLIITGVLGITISTPIRLVLSKRIKSLQIIYINQEYRDTEEFRKFQRTSYKPVQPPKYN